MLCIHRGVAPEVAIMAQRCAAREGVSEGKEGGRKDGEKGVPSRFDSGLSLKPVHLT